MLFRSNVAPQQTHDMCQYFFEGKIEESCKLQFEAMGLCDALFCEVNPIPVKKALNLMGKNVGSLRLPLTEMEDENVKKLESEMKIYGLI